MYVLATDWWYKYDFLAKVDPDAILFPERLRGHVAAHVGQNVFFLNCAVHAPAMYGAVEAPKSEPQTKCAKQQKVETVGWNRGLLSQQFLDSCSLIMFDHRSLPSLLWEHISPSMHVVSTRYHSGPGEKTGEFRSVASFRCPSIFFPLAICSGSCKNV